MNLLSAGGCPPQSFTLPATIVQACNPLQESRLPFRWCWLNT
ncbi:hypothetical protein TCEL_00364 [Thermobrachium celere DSM 8682]|uniref:Uncharacterized protein n=1 Tax=Thermobrachium celere DSM 8682 TaxID=941824 RepID=R7RSP8_9CLOT|nr:hypothetical protein TCEL_00364 [Thermobrachium celere DSM 8682]